VISCIFNTGLEALSILSSSTVGMSRLPVEWFVVLGCAAAAVLLVTAFQQVLLLVAAASMSGCADKYGPCLCILTP
jgi:hypothetical protein